MTVAIDDVAATGIQRHDGFELSFLKRVQPLVGDQLQIGGPPDESRPHQRESEKNQDDT